MDILQTSGVTFLFNHSALHFMPHFSWLPNIKVEQFVSDKIFITNAFPWFENKTLHAWFGIRQRRLPIPWKQKARACIWTHNVPDPALTHKEMRSHLKIFFSGPICCWDVIGNCNRTTQAFADTEIVVVPLHQKCGNGSVRTKKRTSPKNDPRDVTFEAFDQSGETWP